MVNRIMQKAEDRPDRISFPVLVSRWVIFLFFMCVFVIFLYAIGNIQGFMDTTQLFLLNLVSFFSLFLSAGAILGFGQALFLYIQKGISARSSPENGTSVRRYRYLLGALSYAFLAMLGILAAVTAILIITASERNVV